jgi:hypothetical protein
MRTALGVERSTVAAANVHLARKQVGDKGATNENATQDYDGEQRVPQPLCFSRKLR